MSRRPGDSAAPSPSQLLAVLGGGAALGLGYLLHRTVAMLSTATKALEETRDVLQTSIRQESRPEFRPKLVSSKTVPPAEGEEEDEKTKTWKLVLTGGPCAGKSTAIASVKNFLQNRGYFVVTVSEAATFLHNNGIDFYPGEPLLYQKTISSTQRDHENRIFRFAERYAKLEGTQAVVLCDRGLQDGRSYCSWEEWRHVLRAIDLPEDEEEIKKRYSAVFHLVTAADGAEDHYTKTSKEGKQIRDEGPEQAAALDRKLQQAWRGHSHHRIIYNRGSFQDKIADLQSSIAQFLGLPETRRMPSRFQLNSLPKSYPAGLRNLSEAVFTKTYVNVPNPHRMKRDKEGGTVMFVRERKQESRGRNHVAEIRSYVIKTIHLEGPKEVENQRALSRREYEDYRRLIDETRHIIKQRRIQFFLDERFYEIVEYLGPSEHKGLLLCNIHQKANSEGHMAKATVPSFLDVKDDVTNNPRFSAHFLSLRGSKSPVTSRSPLSKGNHGHQNDLKMPPPQGNATQRSQSSHMLSSLSGKVN